MRTLLVLGVVGFLAQLVDGSLGMGYGVTSTSMLLTVGLTPAVASASVHLAEVGTNAASGFAHWRLGNVDKRLVLRLGVPGAVGAFVGATFLSHLSTAWAAPLMAGILLVLGVYILLRFAVRPPAVSHARTSPHGSRFLVPLGFVGGFVDATGGGGWGPVSTTTLLSAGKTAPRTVVGSVDTSEFLVTASASVAFVIGLGMSGIDLRFVAVLLVGGLIAAPVAAWLVSRLPAPVLGTGVGGLIVLTNLRSLLSSLEVTGLGAEVAHIVVIVSWVALVTRAALRYRARRAADLDTAFETELQSELQSEVQSVQAEGHRHP